MISSLASNMSVAPRALDNSNPTVLASSSKPARRGGAIDDLKGKKAVKALWQEEDSFEGGLASAEDEDEEEEIDAQEVYDLLRSITDPEHPLTLEQLAVVTLDQIKVGKNHVLVELTPTIPHCSMATLIGLSLRVRLLRSLPPRYKVDLRIKAGTHQSEHAVNKQLNDKERVQAALENRHLLDVVEGCLASAGQRGGPLQTGAAGVALHG